MFHRSRFLIFRNRNKTESNSNANADRKLTELLRVTHDCTHVSEGICRSILTSSSTSTAADTVCPSFPLSRHVFNCSSISLFRSPDISFPVAHQSPFCRNFFLLSKSAKQVRSSSGSRVQGSTRWTDRRFRMDDVWNLERWERQGEGVGMGECKVRCCFVCAAKGVRSKQSGN